MYAADFVRDLKEWGCPEEPGQETLDRLLEAYHGDPSSLARDAIIMSLAFPVVNMVARHRNRNNAMDILGEALLTLVECVDRWGDVAEDGNIQRYVEFSVKKRVKDFIDNDSVLKVPSRRVREKAAQGEEIETLATFSLNPHDPEETESPVVFPDTTLDVRDYFETRVGSSDLQIIELKSMGCTIDEIAQTIGITKNWVYRRLRHLRQAHACIGDAA